MSIFKQNPHGEFAVIPLTNGHPHAETVSERTLKPAPPRPIESRLNLRLDPAQGRPPPPGQTADTTFGTPNPPEASRPVRGKLSAISRQPSAVSRQPSAISYQPSAVGVKHLLRPTFYCLPPTIDIPFAPLILSPSRHGCLGACGSQENREDGVIPSRSRRCNRGQKPHTPLQSGRSNE